MTDEQTFSPPDADDPVEPMTLPPGLWEKLKNDPQYAPENLALEAVTRLGPQARNWVIRTRGQLPGISPDALATIATKRFVNRARLSGAVSGITGLPGAVVDVGVLAWTQAAMVLHIAAAYDVDPTDPERAAELLVLQGVHKIVEGARVALNVATGEQRISELFARRNTRPGRCWFN